MTAQSEATNTSTIPDGFYNRYHDNLTPVIPSTYTIGADGQFTSYDRGDYDPTTYSIANGMDDTVDKFKPNEFVNPYLGGPRRIAAGTYGPDSKEVAPHLSSIHKQDSWTNDAGLWDDNSYFTTTDLSAPLGGTYSLMSNTGANADAPITYDFLNHMPDTWDRRAGQSSVGDYTGGRGPFGLDVSDPRYTEEYRSTLHNVADSNASRAFQRNHNDAMNARLGDYEYGTAYALDNTSPNKGVDPIPLLGEWVMPNPNDLRYAGPNTRDAVLEWDAGMGPDYEYSEQNYSGYDGNRFKTLDENGSVIEYEWDHQNGVPIERAGEDFNSGGRFKKFNNIDYIKDRINPAVHPEYMGRDGELVKWENGYNGNNPYDDNNHFGDVNTEYDPNYNPNQQYYDNPQQQSNNNYNQQSDYYNQQSDWKPNYNYQTNQYDAGYGPPDVPTSTGPSYGSDYGSAMTNQMNTPSSSSGGGFGLGYDSAMTSEMGSDTASAKGFSTEYEENIKGLLDTLRGGG